MNQNHFGLVLIIIILIFVALLAGGIIVWQYFGVLKEEVKAPKEKIEEAVPEEVIEEETTNWKTYRNEEYGFEIKYPAEYTLKENVEKVTPF